MSGRAPERIGAWRVLEQAGRGGMGVVLRVEGPDGRPAALKLLKAGLLASEAQRRRFATEVQTLLRLRHPGVVAALDAGEHQGVPFLVMEWVEGETLAARLAREGPLDVAEALELAGGLGEALAHCHAQGVLHRDLKPENVLLRARDGAALLSDFGLAKDLLAEGAAPGTLSGEILGTPGYWAPEQVWGPRAAIGPRSDVYGLGAVLYAALTGEPPQGGDSLQAVLESSQRPVRPPGALRPGLPAWLDAVCLQALDPDPARRHPDAAALAAALARGGAVARPGAGVLALVAGVALLAALGLGRARTVPAQGEGPTPDRGGGDGDVEALLVRARERERAGDARGALEALDRAVAGAPERVDLLQKRAGVHVTLHEPDAALDDLERALGLDPTLVDARVNRGLLRLDRQDREGALQDFELAVAQAPDHAQAREARATLRHLQGDLAGAEEDYARAIELNPASGHLRFNRAALYLAQGRIGAARADYDRALELEPGHVAAWNDRGQLRERQGDPEGAREDYTRALELQPDYVRAWFNRGVLRERQGDLPGALADLERALELDPQVPPVVHEARERVARRLGGE